MSRRQALGVIQNGNQMNQQQQQQQALKQSSSSASFKSSNFAFNPAKINDENEPPKAPPATKSSKQQDYDFEIFQEEFNDFKSTKPTKQQQQQSSIAVFDEKSKKEKENEFSLKEDYEEDEQDYEPEEEEDDEEEEEDENEQDEDLEEEEEGISRLNLAAINECSTNAKHAELITNEPELMSMDSSSFHNDSISPMILDDTIKFQSMLSSKLDDEQEEEEEEEQVDELDQYEDTDEETKKKLAAAEREAVLMNCLEYKDDIMKYMRKLEVENRPKVNYMKKQQDITSSMRAILVDWLVEVSEEYKLNMETLYLAVNYTDRFLSQMSVLRGKLQLVGTASMYIASKYEEITPPDVNEFVYITDDTYTKKQVLRMEHLLLKILDFKMSPPTANWFLMHFLRFIKLNTCLSNKSNADLCSRIEHLSRYLAELTLIDIDTFVQYLPSQIAASAIYLAMFTLGRPWTKQIADIIGYGYDLGELKACIIDLYKAMQQAPQQPQQAIQEKYKQPKYDYISSIEPPKSLPSFIYHGQQQHGN